MFEFIMLVLLIINQPFIEVTTCLTNFKIAKNILHSQKILKKENRITKVTAKIKKTNNSL